MTLHLIARLSVGSPVARAVVGGAAWAAWYLVVAAAVFVAATFGLWPEGVAGLLGLAAGAGAVFALLAGSRSRQRPGRVATAVGVTAGALVIAACFVTAGWWGRPV